MKNAAIIITEDGSPLFAFDGEIPNIKRVELAAKDRTITLIIEDKKTGAETRQKMPAAIAQSIAQELTQHQRIALAQVKNKRPKGVAMVDLEII